MLGQKKKEDVDLESSLLKSPNTKHKRLKDAVGSQYDAGYGAFMSGETLEELALMEEEDSDEYPPRPAATINSAGIWSMITYSWINGLVKIGFKRALDESDLPESGRKDRARELANQMEKAYEAELRIGRTNIRWPLIRVFGWEYFLISLCYVVGFGGSIGQVLILKKTIGYISDGKPTDDFLMNWFPDLNDTYYGLILCILMGAFALLQVFNNHYSMFGCGRVGIQARSAAAVMIYRKILKLRGSVLREMRMGQVTNLVANDAYRIETAFQFAYQLFWSPFFVLVCMGLLMNEVSWAALLGLATLFFLGPVQAKFGKITARIRRATILCTDERIRYLSELLQGVRVVKYFAWEPGFFQKVGDVRYREYEQIKLASYYKAANDAVFFASTGFMTLIVFILHVYINGSLNAATAFTCMGLFNLMGRYIISFPRSYSFLVEALEGCHRISSFLTREETEHGWVMGYRPPSTKSSYLTIREEDKKSEILKDLENNDIILDDASFVWDKIQNVPTLKKISLSLTKGSLLAVIGKVGSGKSSFINALLGEMWKVEGEMFVNGKLAYVPQQAWILNRSLRENIVMGHPFNETRYREVLKVCCLESDLLLLPAGDMTEIGEKGINLSGGQKQRISLARACYGEADIILLDDPLSAVDQNVGKSIFENCICGFLAKKTRILVLHQLSYLPRSEITKIMELHQGSITGYGSYDLLLAQGSSLTPSASEMDLDSKLKKSEEETKKKTKTEKPSGGLTEKEDRGSGSVNWSTYSQYIDAGGGVWIWVLVFSLFAFTQISVIMSSYWLAWWTDDKFSWNPTNGVASASYYIYGLLAITLLSLVFAFTRAVLLARITLTASSHLHNEMFMKILRSPVSFFDTTPLGRILNRFGHDVDQVDQYLPFNILNLFHYAISVAGSLITIAFVTPWFAIAFAPILLVFIYFQMYSQRTARQIKRLSGVTKSPIYSHLSSTLLGLDSVRAYSQQQRFNNIFTYHTDLNSVSVLLFLAISRWLGIRLDMLSAAVVTATTSLVVYFKDTIGPGLAGVAVSQSLLLAGYFQWAVRQASEVENSMTSVERIGAYNKLESEGKAEFDGNTTLTNKGWKFEKRWTNWPHSGKVEFRNVTMSYRPGLDPVLRGISFVVKHGQRVGIAGRTGAGKSSILVSLFRMAELSGGQILIDNQDIGQMPLYVLRSKISIIPQDPVLFQGTIRVNLDPLQNSSDEELWEVLRRVHLTDNIRRLQGGLDFKVEENGGNLSVGERQLLCLGRALLRNSRVIVMDEATANVDMATDNMIQRTIRSEFRDATVFTIAHRINTIIDSDMILVMSDGVVGEYAPPSTLLADPSSLFSQLVQLSPPIETESKSSSDSSSDSSSSPSSSSDMAAIPPSSSTLLLRAISFIDTRNESDQLMSKLASNPDVNNSQHRDNLREYPVDAVWEV